MGLYTGAEGDDDEYASEIADKVVLADKVGTAASYVFTGDCVAGFVYSSDIYRYDGIEEAFVCPEDSHKPIVYPGAVAESSEHADEAKAFIDFCLTNKKAQKIWAKYGFRAFRVVQLGAIIPSFCVSLRPCIRLELFVLNRFRMLVACALTFALCWVPGFAFAGDAEDGAQRLLRPLMGFPMGSRVLSGWPRGPLVPWKASLRATGFPLTRTWTLWWRLLPIALWCGYRPRRSRSLIDPQDNECVSGLKALVCELDSANCMGVRSWGTWIFLGMSRRKQRLMPAGIPMALTNEVRMGTAMW